MGVYLNYTARVDGEKSKFTPTKYFKLNAISITEFIDYEYSKKYVKTNSKELPSGVFVNNDYAYELRVDDRLIASIDDKLEAYKEDGYENSDDFEELEKFKDILLKNKGNNMIFWLS